MSAIQPSIVPPRTANRRVERLWDVSALVCMAAGAGLFYLARRALQSIAAGTYDLPPGTSAVARTDLHVLQSQAGIALVCVGVLVGVYSAWRFRG